jgi:hypothetical protein
MLAVQVVVQVPVQVSSAVSSAVGSACHQCKQVNQMSVNVNRADVALDAVPEVVRVSSACKWYKFTVHEAVQGTSACWQSVLRF